MTSYPLLQNDGGNKKVTFLVTSLPPVSVEHGCLPMICPEHAGYLLFEQISYCMGPISAASAIWLLTTNLKLLEN